mmetsp:Transcript_69317/g.178632  ORF Transcript_69317/g.178632 Transcript_69317/m.178632 type:complete len:221 (+) Transcript_69317:301-963(+)
MEKPVQQRERALVLGTAIHVCGSIRLRAVRGLGRGRGRTQVLQILAREDLWIRGEEVRGERIDDVRGRHRHVGPAASLVVQLPELAAEVRGTEFAAPRHRVLWVSVAVQAEHVDPRRLLHAQHHHRRWRELLAREVEKCPDRASQEPLSALLKAIDAVEDGALQAYAVVARRILVRLIPAGAAWVALAHLLAGRLRRQRLRIKEVRAVRQLQKHRRWLAR